MQERVNSRSTICSDMYSKVGRRVYRFFEPSNAPFDADYLIAGDGVYRVMDCFGLRVPVPLIAAQIRGLPKLLPWLHGNRVACSPVGDFGPSYHILTADQPTVPPIE